MATKKPLKKPVAAKKTAAKTAKGTPAKTAAKKTAVNAKAAPKKLPAGKAPLKSAPKTLPKEAEKKVPAAAKAQKKSAPASKAAKRENYAANINDSLTMEEKPGKQAKKRALAAADHKRKLNDKIRQLIHLSKEKGFLTNQDINKYLTETPVSYTHLV